MGTRKFFTFTTHFDFVNRCVVKEASRGDMLSFVNSFRDFISKFLVFVFGSIVTNIFSFNGAKCYEQNQSGSSNQMDTSCCRVSERDGFGREDNGFQVHNREHVDETDEQKENSVVMETALASSTNKYEFLSGKHIRGFMEEPKTSIFSVKELYMVSSDSTNIYNRINLDTEEVRDQEKAEDYLENVTKKREGETFTENEERVFTEYKFLRNYDSLIEVPYLLKTCSFPVDSELDTTDSSDVSEGLATESLEAMRDEEKVENIESILDQATSVMEHQTFDSDDDYIELKPESRNSSDLDEDMLSIEDLLEAENKHEEEDLVHRETEAVDSIRISEEPQLENSSILDEEILSTEDLNEAENNPEKENLVYDATKSVYSSVEFKESSLEQQTEYISDYDDEDEDDSEFSFEQQDLIEQLKMELRNARTGGLPTIMEESESPKMVEELRPLKLDNKFEYKDRIVEIHKFYRSYLNKMRKLDTLSSQTMHAIGLLQLKEPAGQLIKSQKSAFPAIKYVLSQNLWPSKPRRVEANPTLKLIGELHKDFQLAYVGHLCLSWEILNWQYRKAFELLEYDAQELRRYNQVAGEFQLFQVLLQRFIENEPFQGIPRVQNYVKNRHGLCNFLQVPVIREDNLKDKKGWRGGEDAITSSMLTEIIEESMRVFWEFLRSDKDEADLILRGPELQDSIDSELLTDIQTDFQRKEKKLKEMLRSSSCIVKRLQKHPRLDYVMFLAQIELKLVSRVLTMSKLTTDQLVWCHEKLAKMNFCNRKLLLEPSFLLFPC